ncbi:MAG: ferrous iron transport protein B [Candidatus Auribacterota bacterium]|jgi:ferrous iron transport protein B|nr:ferrous iron transport protein B [Candidatus Auribacterota bacterium]
METLSKDKISLKNKSYQATKVVALTGNPNSGKTTIFNNLTGSRQHVANYPGVTVEIKESRVRNGGRDLKIVDLPGCYSLTPYSKEELIARNFIIDRKPDLVVDIIDLSNLERNLYLTVQLLELGIPIVLVLNQSDLAKRAGLRCDLAKLSRLLNVPVVETVGNRNIGTSQLLDTIWSELSNPRTPRPVIYENDFEEGIRQLCGDLKNSRDSDYPDKRWTAIKLIENDVDIKKRVWRMHPDADALSVLVDSVRRRLTSIYDTDPELAIADQRYGVIAGICRECTSADPRRRRSASDAIDSVALSKTFGLPLFLLTMYVVFHLTFTTAQPAMDFMEYCFVFLSSVLEGLWPEGSQSLLKSLLVDGIIAGVGSVVIFLPNILLLFLAIAVLEDSGYMARIAFLMDRIMNKIGLHGKSFIPMLTGFGCSIPGIMATRTLEHEHDRLTTMLVLPLISCGARLPIYGLIIPAFFSAPWQAPVLWIIYITGIALSIVCARLLRSTILKGNQAPFVLELPPYRMPTVKGIFIHMWQKGWMYLRKAGTIILGISIVLWAMSTFPKPPEESLHGLTQEQVTEAEMAYSVAGRIGKAMEPLIKPLSFDWKIGTALVGALAAKEVFVAQLGIVYSMGEADEESESLRDTLRRNYNPLTGFCIMLFCLISAPCIATFAVTKKESGSWKWAFFQFIGLTVIAYIVTFAVYQTGRALGIGV